MWEGNAKGYYEDGKLYWEGTYHKDFLDGIFTYYSKTGEITKKVTYVKGKKIKTEKN
jgi:antitoxin component YwqK of YwqJK toxin-antitoxin module